MYTEPGNGFLNAATVIEQIDDVDQLRRRLHDDPGDLIASTQLEAIHRRNGDWEQLVAVLIDRAEQLDEQESATMLIEVAEVYKNGLGDFDSAMVVLLTAFSRDPYNAELANSLDAIAASTGNYETLIDSYVVAAAKLGATDADVASELWLRAAFAHLISANDVHAAQAALERVGEMRRGKVRHIIDHLESSARSPEVVEMLADVARRTGDNERRLRLLSKLMSMTSDFKQVVALHYEVATLHLELGDLATAEWHLVEVTRLNPNHSDAVAALSELYKQRGEWLKAARILEQSRTRSGNRLDRAHLSFEAANIYADALGEHTVACNLYESALVVDPEHIGAALPLAQRYYDSKRWHELEPIIDMLVRRAGALGDEAPSAVELHTRAAETAANLGNLQKAQRYYDAALRMSPDDLRIILGAADVFFQLKDWSAALERYADVMARLPDHSSKQAAMVITRIAECYRENYDVDTAFMYFRRALEIDPSDKDLVSAIAEICVVRGDFQGAIDAKQRLSRLTSGKEKVRLLADVASMTSRHMEDPEKAIQIYRAALEIDGTDREVLHQLVEHYSAAQWWEDAVDMIIRITELENNSVRRGKYFQFAGVIARRELGAVDQAAQYYESALECFFASGTSIPSSLRDSCMKAFTDLGKMLTQNGRWKALEQSYRRMIHHMDPNDPAAGELWHGLGTIYRRHLGHRDSAISSFEVASALDDKRLTRHRILVDLYEEAGAERAMEAIVRRQRLLVEEPLVAAHYKALRKLYAVTRQYDKAWCVCRALAYLGQADDDEQKFLNSRRQQFVWPSGAMTEQSWAYLRDPNEQKELSAVLAVISETIGVLNATSFKQLGLSPDVPGTEQFANLVKAVTDTLGVDAPMVFVHPNVEGDVLWANARKGRKLKPVIAIGGGLYQGKDMASMVASIAKSMTFARPDYFLRMAANGLNEIEAAFLAAASMSRPDVPVPARDVPTVNALQRLLSSTLSRAEQNDLAAAVSRFVQAGRAYDFNAWARSVDATSRRAALLVSGDLEAAVAAGGSADQEQVGALITHSVSEQHFALRVQLGIARE